MQAARDLLDAATRKREDLYARLEADIKSTEVLGVLPELEDLERRVAVLPDGGAP